MTRSDATARVLKVAGGEVGVKESPVGSNFGPRVGQYLAATGIRRPAFWCASFCAWVGDQAIGDAWPLPPSASCDVLLDYARRHKVLRNSPQVGDVFLVMASANDAIHAGFVTGVNPGGASVATIEGNSNSGGSRNGIEVARRPERAIDPPGRHRLQFVRWSELIDEGDEEESWVLVVGTSGVRIPLLYEDGTTLAPLRSVLRAVIGPTAESALGWDDGPIWTGTDGKVTAIPLTVTIRGGVGYVPVRPMAAWMGCRVEVNLEEREVRLVRGA